MKQYYRWIPFSMVDSPDGSCAILFSKGCPLRCSFCYNIDLLKNKLNGPTDITYREVIRNIKFLKGINPKNGTIFKKVDWLIISGGEPFNQDFFKLLRIVLLARKIGLKIGIYTNGLYPYKLLFFIKTGLVQFVNCDYKNELKRYGCYEKKIRKSLQIIKKYKDKIVYRINTVVTRGISFTFSYLFSEMMKIFTYIPIYWSDQNKFNCWQITPVLTTVPTIGNLGVDSELDTKDREVIKSYIQN